MIGPGPSVAEERADALHRMVKTAPASTWKSHGLVLRVVFFFFTAFAAAALGGLMHLFGLPQHFLGAAICIATGETLIYRLRFFGTGIEAALLSAGLVNLILMLPHSGKVEAVLVFALAAAIVGARMRSAIFGSIAAILVIAYFGAKFPVTHWPAILVAYAISVAAALARTREWQRPSTEELFGLMAVSAPVAGYFASAIQSDFGASLEFGAAFVVLAVMLMTIGVTRRDRIVMIAGAVAMILAAIEWRDLFTTPVEVKLMIGGAAVLAIAVALTRALRDRTHGFVLAPAEPSQLEDAVQMIGTFAAAHPGSGPSQSPQREAGGGSFGGAGASGDF